MTLKPVRKSPGLFVDDQWRPRTPGLFALVIGVSDYEHLDGSAASYRLKPLNVAALTAYEVFDWLSNGYRYPAAPIAQCWFLAAPSRLEREFMINNPNAARASAFAHAAPATMDSAETAILSWFEAMERLPEEVARASRSLFFFSGHGIEMTHERQIALPSDWAPRMPDRAISIANLRAGCASLPVHDQFVFLDACRNDIEALRGADIRGARILTDWGMPKVVSRRNAPLMYASASGSKSWGPKKPSDGVSLFGEALVTGLRGRPTISLDCTPRDCAVLLYALHDFVGERVEQLLTKWKATARQWVELGGSVVKNPVITYVGAPASLPPRDPTHPVRDPFGDLPERFTASDAAAMQLSDRPEGERHTVFGSETMTEALDAVRIVDFATHASVGPDDYSIVSVRRDDERRRYRIELELEEGTYFLKVPLAKEPSRSAAACVLSNSERTAYVVDLYRDGDGKFFFIDARYATRGNDTAARMGKLWMLAARTSAGEAVASPDFLAAEMTVGVINDPMTAALLALLHVRAHSAVPDAVVEVMLNDPRTSDAEVLAFEAALQAGEPWSDGSVDALAAAVHRHGLPVFGPCISYLDRRADEILDEDRQEERLTHTTRSALREVRDRVHAAVRYFRPGALFVSFVSEDPSALTAQLVLPREKKATRGSTPSGSARTPVQFDEPDDFESEAQAGVWA